MAKQNIIYICSDCNRPFKRKYTLEKHEKAHAHRLALFNKIKAYLKQKGVVALSEIYAKFNTYHYYAYKIFMEHRDEVLVFNLALGKGRGGIVFGGTMLFNGFAGIQKYVCLKDDPRLITFVASTIPQPVSTSKVRALQQHLTRIFDRETAYKITEQIYNYSEQYTKPKRMK